MSENVPTACGPLCDRQHQVDEPHNRNLAPVQPQDHLPANDGVFRFAGRDGKTYTLPEVTEKTAAEIPGDVSYAAIMEPDNDMAQMRLAFTTLEACHPDPAALKALQSLSTKEMLETLGRWMGESSGSSA